MSVVADLIALGAPATWMDGSDSVKEQPVDPADASRPDIWQYEGVRYASSGIGPSGEAGLTITGAYGSSWSFLAAVFNDLGSISESGAHPGHAWDATSGRFVARYFIDASVKAEASYLLPFSVYSGTSRDSVGALAEALQVGFYDVDGTHFGIDLIDGPNIETLLWSDIINTWLEFDTNWTAASVSGSDGVTSVRLRTSTDGTTWTDLGTVLTDSAASDRWVRDGGTPLGMSVALGFAGMPGKCYYAILYGPDAALSSRNLLTGSSHTVQGSDNLIVGSGGTVTGDKNALFALCDDSPAPEITGDRTFKVCADTIDLSADSLLLNGVSHTPIRVATIALTDAQIKALPTTPFELLPAVPGKDYQVVSARLYLDTTAGTYTNVSTVDGAQVVLQYDNGGGDYVGAAMYQEAPGTAFSTFLSGAHKQSWRPVIGGYTDWSATNGLLTYSEGDHINKNIVIAVSNGGSGNLTGGHPSNSLVATVLYLEIEI